MTWEVELIGEPADLQMLSEVFTDSSLRIVNGDHGFIVTSDSWGNLNTAEDVLASADRAAASLSGASFLILGMTTPLSVGNVNKIDENGTRHVTMFANSGEYRMRTYPVAITYGGQTHYPAEPVREHYAIASRQPAVERALSLRSMDRPNWVRLYNLYEIIEHDVGGLMRDAGWASKSELDRFRRSANSPAVSGDDSRHSVDKHHPPPQPMSIEDARELIDRLLLNWINSKAAGSSET